MIRRIRHWLIRHLAGRRLVILNGYFLGSVNVRSRYGIGEAMICDNYFQGRGDGAELKLLGMTINPQTGEMQAAE